MDTEVDTCWFCETQPAAPGREVNVDLRKEVHTGWTDVKRTFSGIQGTPGMLPASVRVPRCEACARLHMQVKITSWVIAIPLAALTTLTAYTYSAYFFEGSALPVALLGALGSLFCVWPAFFMTGSALGRMIGEKAFLKGRRAERSVEAYPPVLELLAQGYNLGRAPTGMPSVFRGL